MTEQAENPSEPQRRMSRRAKVLAWVVGGIVYAAIMWFWVFPWVDRNFVNRPTL